MGERWDIDLGVLPYVTLNKLGHWGTRYKCAQTWHEVVKASVQHAKVPALSRPVIGLKMHPATRHKRDADNLSLPLKWSVDGVQLAGVIEDDTTDDVFLRMPQVEFDPDRKGRWTLTIETTT